MATSNNTDFHEQAEKFLEQQDALYNKLDFRNVFEDKKEVIRHFIESEDCAKVYAFQGKFYPMAHYEIAKITKTKMSDIDEKDIIKTFYHLLRLGCTPTIQEFNYIHLQQAMEMLLPDLNSDNYLICNLEPSTTYILFGIENEESKEAITNTTYEDYCTSLKFIYKCHTYSYMDSMLKKKDSFLPFLTNVNAVLFERIKKGVVLFSTKTHHQNIGFNFNYGAFLIMLLLSSTKDAKEVLREVHKEDLTANLVWVLGTFYKSFQNSKDNKEVLEDLYLKFPANWIDEYQEKTYDWENY